MHAIAQMASQPGYAAINTPGKERRCVAHHFPFVSGTLWHQTSPPVYTRETESALVRSRANSGSFAMRLHEKNWIDPDPIKTYLTTVFFELTHATRHTPRYKTARNFFFLSH